MRRPLVIFVALAGLALVYGVAWYTQSAFTPAQTNNENEMQEEEQMSIVTAVVSEETAEYTIDARYPKFNNLAIDSAIGKFINDAITQFKADAFEDPPFPSGTRYEFTSIFNGVYIGEDIMSARLIVSIYMGGAHPVSFVYGLNFDRATGRELTQEDALRMLDMSLEQVSAEAISELNAQFDEGVFFVEGAVAKPENYSTFAIDEGTVTFIFQPYQVAPYAAGVREVSFPRVR